MNDEEATRSEPDLPPPTPTPLGLDRDLAFAEAERRLLGRELTPVTLDRFVVLHRLGQGAMGVVYAAHDPKLDRKVALKLVDTSGFGSEGVLGIVTRVVLKLHPLPRGTSTALVALADFDAALSFLRHAQQSLSGQVSAFEIMWREYLDVAVATNRLRRPFAADYPVYVLTDMHCGQPETDARRFETMLEQAIESGWVLDAAVAQSMADAEALWAIRDGIAEVLRERAPTLNFDVSVPVGRIGECVARMRANLERGWPQLQALFFGHVGDGNVHVVVCKVPQDADSLHAIEEAVYGVMRDYGGSVSAEHGIGVLKRDWLAYSRTPAELALMRTLKTALDPRGILNPGKML